MPETDPWSDDQIQSTPVGPPDAAPWTLTLVVIALLVLLLLGGYILWRQNRKLTEPASSPAPVRQSMVVRKTSIRSGNSADPAA